MSHMILTDADDRRLGVATLENLYALFRAMGVHLGGTLRDGDDICYHLTPPSNPMFKGVWRNRMSDRDADRVIDETLAWFEQQGAPFLFWWTGVNDTPSDIGERLLKRGLLSYEAQMASFAPGIISTDVGAPSMAADLFALNETLMMRTPTDFHIDIARDESDLSAFKQVFLASYGVPDWAGQAWVDATLHHDISAAPWTIYIGRQAEVPVAITILFNGEGVAGVYGVGTLPGERGKGYGAAITMQPLLDARAQGYRYGVLFSSEMGLPVYERMGFRVVPGRINRYLWRNPQVLPT